MAIQKHPVKSKFCKLRLLCRSLAGNNVYYLTVTANSNDEEAIKVNLEVFCCGFLNDMMGNMIDVGYRFDSKEFDALLMFTRQIHLT